MICIILASGIGKRLFPLTKEIPKPLIEIGGSTILERIIDSLIDNKLTKIIITTGHLEEKIKKFIKRRYPKLNITFVRNPIYEKTNYIYSLYLVKNLIKRSDIILSHGDILFDRKLMKKIINSKESCVLTKKDSSVPDKDFKVRINNGLIVEIGVNVFGENTRFSLPLYKILKVDLEKWMKEIERFVEKGNINCYAEDALNNIINKIKIKPLYYTDKFAMEIDDFEDLEKARDFFRVNRLI